MLQRKNAKVLTICSSDSIDSSIIKEYAPFISSGSVSLLRFSTTETPVPILRDTGASQSLILESTLPFSVESANGNEVML